MQFLIAWGCVEKPEKAGVSQPFLPLLKCWWAQPESGKPGQKRAVEVKNGGERHWQGGTCCPGKGTPKASEL